MSSVNKNAMNNSTSKQGSRATKANAATTKAVAAAVAAAAAAAKSATGLPSASSGLDVDTVLPAHDEHLDLDLELQNISSMSAAASAGKTKVSISKKSRNSTSSNAAAFDTDAAGGSDIETTIVATGDVPQGTANRSKKQKQQQAQQQAQFQLQQQQAQIQQQNAVDTMQQQMRLFAQATNGKQQTPGNRPPLMFDYALAAAAAAAYNPLAAAVAAAAARSMSNPSNSQQLPADAQQLLQQSLMGRNMTIGQNELQAAQLLHQTMAGSNALDSLLQQSDPNNNNNKHPIGSEEWMRQRRENHREVERKRRETISDGIAELAKLVPDGDKNKGSVLQRAVQYIMNLKQQEISNNEQWAMEKNMLEQMLSDVTKQNEILKEDNQALRQRITDDAQQGSKRSRHVGF